MHVVIDTRFIDHVFYAVVVVSWCCCFYPNLSAYGVSYFDVWCVCRTRAHIENEQYWLVMKDHLSYALKWTYEEMVEAGVSPRVFLAAYSGALGLYHDCEQLARILAAGEDVGKVADDIKAVVCESCVGKAMFQTSWMVASRIFYKREIANGLRQLMDHEFVAEEVQAFRATMNNECRTLHELGHRKFERVFTEISYMGLDVGIWVETPEDEYEIRFACALNSCCLDSGHFAMSVWETLLWEKGCVQNMPAFATIPEILLVQIKAAREAAAGFFAFADVTRLADMIKIL
jgi:hypothetical protein